MAILLLGRWDHGTLHIEESHEVEDGDEDTINGLAKGQCGALAWTTSYAVGRHSEAVQWAYDECVRDDDDRALVDEAEGFEPAD